MSAFDHSDLDGRLLQLLLAVVEERSVTRAAERLGVTQSAVSHLLDKLRAIVGDPLVVKAGRGIVPTARAESLAERARVLLEDLRGFATPEGFDPATLKAGFTIAANDLQCDLLLPPLLRRLRARAPGVTLRVIPSGVPQAELLRAEACQLVISPRPPDAADLLQRRLFADRYVVFFDAAVRAAPRDLDEYLAAEHLTVVYEPQRRLDIDRVLGDERKLARRFVASVPGFAGIAPFLRGTACLATLPSLLRLELMRDFAAAPLPPPLAVPEMPMFMIWHARRQSDPVHRWLRDELLAVVQALSPALPPALPPAGRA
ncbi:MAG: LysR family transcriptional regulator [Proteobacteria bacterium]|nr:LysR family transcriptional regulator [Pseudomonadota bacterium]